MPLIANSSLTAASAGSSSSTFTPTSDFWVCCTAGVVFLEVQYPGNSDWLSLGEFHGGQAALGGLWAVARSLQAAPTSAKYALDIAGSLYRLTVYSGPATAYGWSA